MVHRMNEWMNLYVWPEWNIVKSLNDFCLQERFMWVTEQSTTLWGQDATPSLCIWGSLFVSLPVTLQIIEGQGCLLQVRLRKGGFSTFGRTPWISSQPTARPQTSAHEDLLCLQWTVFVVCASGLDNSFFATSCRKKCACILPALTLACNTSGSFV